MIDFLVICAFFLFAYKLRNESFDAVSIIETEQYYEVCGMPVG